MYILKITFFEKILSYKSITINCEDEKKGNAPRSIFILKKYKFT